MNYQEYLQTPEWREKAAKARARAGYRCQINAGHKGTLHVHHNTYDRCPHNELPEDLIALCDECHRIVHESGLAPITKSFPALSIRNRVFTFKVDGVETRWPHPHLDVIIVNGSETLSKYFYKQEFDEDYGFPPDCWSLDSIEPDPSSAALRWPRPTGPTCGTCPMNAFGSRINDAGRLAKACHDARRVVVLPASYPQLLLLRVPRASLRNLKRYADLLENYGASFMGVITRLSFADETFTQLQFDYVDIMEEPQFDQVVALSISPLALRMLENPDKAGRLE